MCVAVQQTGPGGSSSSGGGMQQLVRCSYLVAADGAHSVIRWVTQQRQQQLQDEQVSIDASAVVLK